VSRRVSVELILEAAQYLREGKQVLLTTMAVDKAVDDLGDEADATGRDMEKLAANTDVAKHQVDDFGDKARGSARDLALLDARIAATKASVRSLGLEFARTGDEIAGTSLDKDRSLLGKLERLRKELDDLDEKPPVPGVQSVVGRGITLPGAHGIWSVGAPAIAAAIPALAPLGAMISGVVVGTVGTGGIIGGIVAAGHDLRVQAAWQDFTNTLTKESFGSDAFVDPVIHGIDIIKHGLTDLNLGTVLAKGAPAVETLAEGIVGFAKGVLPGLDEAMGQSEKTARIMATGFSDVGESFGEMIGDLADKEGTLEGLQQTFIAINDLVKVTHATFGFLTDSFHASLGPSEAASRALEGIYVWLPPLHEFFKKQADDIHNMRDETAGLVPHLYELSNVQQAVNAGLDPFVGYMRDAARETGDFAGALHDLFGAQLDMDHATLQWKQDIHDLTESVKKNGHSLKENTDEGLRNREMIQGLVEDAMAVREATREQTGSTDLANQAYMRQIQVLEQLLLKLGFTKQQIKELVGTYEINVVARYSAVGSMAQITRNLRAEDRFGGGRATGGPVLPGYTYDVGEQGPERLRIGMNGIGWVTPTTGGWQSAPSSPAGAIDYNRLAAAMSGATVVMDGRVVGELVTAGQASSLYAGHRA